MQYFLSVAVSLTSFVLSAIIGIILIPYLRKIHFGQTILDIGPKWHKSKQGTPIMGGFMFIIASVVTVGIGYLVYYFRYADTVSDDVKTGGLKLLTCVLYALLCCAIGFADDYIKAVKKQNLGLNAKQKMFFQILFAAGFLGMLYALGDTQTYIDFFFFKLELGIFYYPLILLFMVFMTNAVNLTDGIDGLCSTVTVVSMLGLAALCSVLDFTGSSELILYAFAIAGGCIGFLIWNLHPAKCFMGDTGSMYLGGAFTAIGVATKCHLLIVLIGVVYFCEAMSVVLQVISYKTTKKRIFKMSPIHHHFELCNFSEYKIVISFSITGLIFAALAVFMQTL